MKTILMYDQMIQQRKTDLYKRFEDTNKQESLINEIIELDKASSALQSMAQQQLPSNIHNEKPLTLPNQEIIGH